VALAADVGAAILPVVPAGAGLVVRGGKTAKVVLEAAAHADEVVDAAHALSHAGEAVDVARALVEAAGHADEAADAMRAAEEAVEIAAKSGKPPIVIGENMARVREYANRIGGQAYRPWRNEPFDFELALRRNERWIRDQMGQGREIIDIGPDFARRAATGRRSPFYEMER